MENGMNGDEHGLRHSRTRSPSPGLHRSNSRGSSRECRSLVQRNQSMSAKQIRFYRNGARFHPGVKLAVSTERYKEFESLLKELSLKLEIAVRNVHNAVTGKQVFDVSDIEYGQSYVCSSTGCFISLEYGQPVPNWSVPSKKKDSCSPTKAEAKTHIFPLADCKKDFIKPKLATIIKNGKPPQKKVTMLLNQKTALNLDQVLDHLSAKGTLGKVDKLCTLDSKPIKELRDLFNDDRMFIALSSQEKYPDDKLDVEQFQCYRPPWNFSTVPKKIKYIPGLQSEKYLTKVFTVHLHCLLAASMQEAEIRSSRAKSRSSRAYSVSPRVYLPRRPKSASPARNTTPVPPRPKTAPNTCTRPSQFSMKPLTPRKVNESMPLKVVSKPKAGSDKPVAIRPRRQMKVSDKDSAEENAEDAHAKHGYFVYVYNDQFRGDAGHADGRPMASVRPMLAVQVLDDDTNDKENSENKESPAIQDDLDKSDLKPLALSVSPAGPDAILP